LIELLQKIQERQGYLPRAELEELSKIGRIPLSKIFGVATFYHQFKLDAPGRIAIHVCMGTACHLRGNAENYEFLRNLLGIREGRSTSEDGLFTLEKARCFGCCSLAPVVRIGDRLVGHAKPADLRRVILQVRGSLEQEAMAAQEAGGGRGR